MLLANRPRQDSELLAACSLGDEHALEELFRRHGAACLRHAMTVIPFQEQAEDVVKGAFLALWNRAESYDPLRSPARSWLLMLVQRGAVECVRDEGLTSQGQVGRQQAPALSVSASLDPATAAVVRSLTDTAVGLLRQLPERQRRALVLVYWGGYTMAEVAALDHIRIATVRSRCRAALSSLGQVMQPQP